MASNSFILPKAEVAIRDAIRSKVFAGSVTSLRFRLA